MRKKKRFSGGDGNTLLIVLFLFLLREHRIRALFSQKKKKKTTLTQHLLLLLLLRFLLRALSLSKTLSFVRVPKRVDFLRSLSLRLHFFLGFSNPKMTDASSRGTRRVF